MRDQLHRSNTDQVHDEPAFYVILSNGLEFEDVPVAERMLVPLKPAENKIEVKEALRGPEQVYLKYDVLDRERHEQHVRDARVQHEYEYEHVEYRLPFGVGVNDESVEEVGIRRQILVLGPFLGGYFVV